ncbi:MAG: hypothetical protein HYT47_02840 [Candidatus Vogelbacteria bacterium]|nr:hypothetical protein [Candidatus Vogelbacteria bacterium]
MFFWWRKKKTPDEVWEALCDFFEEHQKEDDLKLALKNFLNQYRDKPYFKDLVDKAKAWFLLLRAEDKRSK